MQNKHEEPIDWEQYVVKEPEPSKWDKYVIPDNSVSIEDMTADQAAEAIREVGGRENMPGFDEYLDEHKTDENINRLWAINRGLNQGESFLMSDELTGALTPGDYDENVEHNRLINDNAQQHYPYSYMGGEVVGGIASGLGLAAHAARIPLVAGMNRFAQGSVIAGSEGALTGFGSGEGTEASLRNAGISGTVGAIAGPVGEQVLGFVPGKRKVVNELSDYMRREKIDPRMVGKMVNNRNNNTMTLFDQSKKLRKNVNGIHRGDSSVEHRLQKIMNQQSATRQSRVKKFLTDEATPAQSELVDTILAETKKMIKKGKDPYELLKSGTTGKRLKEVFKRKGDIGKVKKMLIEESQMMMTTRKASNKSNKNWNTGMVRQAVDYVTQPLPRGSDLVGWLTKTKPTLSGRAMNALSTQGRQKQLGLLKDIYDSNTIRPTLYGGINAATQGLLGFVEEEK